MDFLVKSGFTANFWDNLKTTFYLKSDVGGISDLTSCLLFCVIAHLIQLKKFIFNKGLEKIVYVIIIPSKIDR